MSWNNKNEKTYEDLLEYCKRLEADNKSLEDMLVKKDKEIEGIRLGIADVIERDNVLNEELRFFLSFIPVVGYEVSPEGEIINVISYSDLDKSFTKGENINKHYSFNGNIEDLIGQEIYSNFNNRNGYFVKLYPLPNENYLLTEINILEFEKEIIKRISITYNHKLNQPLSIIAWHLEFILSCDNLDSKQLKARVNSINEALSNINEILLEYGKQDLFLAPYVVGDTMYLTNKEESPSNMTEDDIEALLKKS
jgi:hypothetical protein